MRGEDGTRAARRRRPAGRPHPVAAEREDGYAPIASYAILGDGRTIALVAADGQVDWWPIPNIDSAPICAALLAPEGGGHFSLRPVGPYQSERRYLPGTNVLETVYSSDHGKAKVTDSLNFGIAGRLPWLELARRVEGVDGHVDFDWEFCPGDRFGQSKASVTARGDVPLVTSGEELLAVVTKGCHDVKVGPAQVTGRIECRPGQRAIVAIVASKGEPLFIPAADDIDARLDRTVESWRAWARLLPSGGRWAGAVKRSALALKTLRSEADGAIAAAGTTSLPERLGGPKNYDYRFAWIRDTAFTVDAFMQLGLHEEVQGSVSWILAAWRQSSPKLRVFYTLSGAPPERPTELDLPGYRHSRPVVSGNPARDQLQLGVFGDLFDMMGTYVDGGHVLDPATAEMLAEIADRCCDEWQRKDSGIWELTRRQHYTISKIGCWVALDRAYRLAQCGQLPDAHAGRWRRQRDAIKRWVDENCWSEEQQSYTFYDHTPKLDAAVLLAGRTGFERGPRLAGTIEAVVRNLSRGAMVYRYSGAEDEEGAFVACSFWLVSAMAHNGQTERARRLMDQAVRLGNDLGLLAEQVDPQTGDFLGNIPQGLSHLALINAAHALRQVNEGAGGLG
jgi:GH15 family glucan-1,4-alpha-glucosidase